MDELIHQPEESFYTVMCIGDVDVDIKWDGPAVGLEGMTVTG